MAWQGRNCRLIFTIKSEFRVIPKKLPGPGTFVHWEGATFN